MALSPDQNAVITGGAIARVWDLQTGSASRGYSSEGEDHALVAMHPNGGSIVTAGFIPRLWSIETGELLREYRTSDRHEGPRSIAISADGDRIAAAYQHHYSNADYPDEEALTAIWNTDSGETVKVFDASSPGLEFLEDVTSIALSPDGTHILLGTENPREQESYAYELSVGDGVLAHRLGPHKGDVLGAYSTGGKRIVTASGELDYTIRIWNAASSELIRLIDLGAVCESLSEQQAKPDFVSSVSFSLDGSLVVVTADGAMDNTTLEGAWLFDAETGNLLRWINRHPGFAEAALFSDGQTLLGGSYDGSITLWDLRDILARPRFEHSESGTEVRWDLGTLQFAPTVDGPWVDIPGASPFPLSPVGERGFFRVKVED